MELPQDRVSNGGLLYWHIVVLKLGDLRLVGQSSVMINKTEMFRVVAMSLFSVFLQILLNKTCTAFRDVCPFITLISSCYCTGIFEVS
jgi:hypothetical protein